MWIQSLVWEDPLEKSMATYSSILAWRIPWTEEPGRLQVRRVTQNQTQTEETQHAPMHSTHNTSDFIHVFLSPEMCFIDFYLVHKEMPISYTTFFLRDTLS